jgi:hypothetical protein
VRVRGQGERHDGEQQPAGHGGGGVVVRARNFSAGMRNDPLLFVPPVAEGRKGTKRTADTCITVTAQEDKSLRYNAFY